MAERPTKRERRDLARKAKLEEQRRRARRRRRQRLTSILTVLIVAGAIGGLIYLSSAAERNRVNKVNSLAKDAGCTEIQSYEDELAADTPHLVAPATTTYKTNPPTSGNHYGNQTITGVFRSPRQNEAWVHNLEHGFTGVFYKESMPTAVRDELEKLVKARDTKTFIQPRPENEEELVFVAWTKAVRCAKAPDAQKAAALAKAVFDANLGKVAPEAGIGPGTPNGEETGETGGPTDMTSPPAPTETAS